jgi:p-aminobenzoyl-glutamate transporter AbgT
MSMKSEISVAPKPGRERLATGAQPRLNWLGQVERFANALPDPVMIFVALTLPLAIAFSASARSW